MPHSIYAGSYYSYAAFTDTPRYLCNKLFSL